MFTNTEKGYLILTLCFLAAGSGIKAYRHAAVKLGPFNGAASALNEAVLPGTEASPHAAETPAPGTEAASPQAEAVSPDSPAFDSAMSGPAAGPDSLGGQATEGDVPARTDPAGGSPTRNGRAVTARPATVKADKSAFTGKVDLNKADASELTRVNGIGAKTAQAIIDYRRAHGPYRNFRDLLQIKGIGEKKLEKLMPNLIL